MWGREGGGYGRGGLREGRETMARGQQAGEATTGVCCTGTAATIVRIPISCGDGREGGARGGGGKQWEVDSKQERLQLESVVLELQQQL